MAGPSHHERNTDYHEPVSPVSLLSENPNVFSDDYAESFNESYADSVAAHSPHNSRTPSPAPGGQSLQHEPSRTPLPGLSSLSHTPSARSRRSTSKNTEDGGERMREEARRAPGPSVMTNFSMRQRASGSVAHRSISSTSDFAGSQSSMSPGEGPSHPYGMYPQGLAMSRTTSTTSSTRPLSHTTTARGPTHPYTLYTQNVGDGTPGGSHQNSIPVGFIGSSASYHRRLGPEGEEQDIIGADGHTEQLPPYSRYPDEVNHKTVVASGLPVIGEQRAEEASPTSPIQNTPPMARGSATSPPSPPSNMRRTGHILDEKTWEGKTSKEKWRMKVFGVPLWLILTIFVLVVFIAIVCGAVIGALIGSRHPKSQKIKSNYSNPWPDVAPLPPPTPATTSSTSLIDVAISTTTPSWVKLPEPGTFVLNPGYPASANFSGCLKEPQQPAWSCNLHDDTLQMNITTLDNCTSISLFSARDELQYGVQPPVVSSGQVRLVRDPETDDSSYAWHFQTFYDKLVVLDGDNSILPLNAQSKRDYHRPWYAQDSPFNQRKSESDPDDVDEQKAWFCYWNQTFLEVLVYAENISNISTATMSSTLVSPPGSSSMPQSTGSSLSYLSSSLSTASLTTSGLYSTSTPSVPSMAPGLPSASWLTASLPGSYPRRNLPQQAWNPTRVQARGTPMASLPPHKIKVEERRVPNVSAPPPTCTLMSRNTTDNTWKASIGANGVIPVVALFEQDPPVHPDGDGPWRVKRGAIPAEACGCQWDMPQ